MHLFRMYWTRTLKKPGAIFLWLLIPFAFMTIYTLVFGGSGGFVPSTGLAIVDRDSSFASGLVAGAFGQGPVADLVKIHRARDLDELEQLFADETASAGLVIPQRFEENVLRGEPTTLTLYKNPRHSIGPQIAEGVVGGLASMGNGLLGLFQRPLRDVQSFVDSGVEPTADDAAAIARDFYSLGQNTPNLAALADIDVRIVEEEADKDETSDFNMAAMFFPGLVAFGLLSLSLSLETRFLYDRTRKVNHRLVVTPIRPFNVVLQQRVYVVVFLYVIAVATAVVGGVIWRIPPVGLFKANLISVALVIFIAGINGSLFALSNSIKAVSAISSLVMMVLMILGGGFFPVEGFQAIQGISKYVPTGIANVGLTQSLTGRELTISIPGLYVYCVAFFVLSIFLGRKRLV